jgi:NTP pyrophosphatase (non-canonical NTP hydrolase)
MEIKEFQTQISKLIDEIDTKLRNNGRKDKHDSDTTMIHLLEEMGEISRQLYNLRTGRDKLNKENLAEEIADVTMLLNKLADVHNIDIEKALNDKINILKKRHNIK